MKKKKTTIIIILKVTFVRRTCVAGDVSYKACTQAASCACRERLCVSWKLMLDQLLFQTNQKTLKLMMFHQQKLSYHGVPLMMMEVLQLLDIELNILSLNKEEPFKI